jgi:hypothetical protein
VNVVETGRPLAVRLREHRHNLKEGLIEKCKLAQHAFEKYHTVDWDKVRILVIESDSRYRKYKQSAHMECLDNPVSQPSQDICAIWIPVIRVEIINSRKYSSDLFTVLPSLV